MLTRKTILNSTLKYTPRFQSKLHPRYCNYFSSTTGKHNENKNHKYLPILIGGVITSVAIVVGQLAISHNDAIQNIEYGDIDGLIAELRVSLQSNQVDIDKDECAARGKPWSSYHKSPKNPNVVVFPYTTEDVQKIVILCKKHHIPIIPFGGGTSIEGQTLALYGGVSIDFSNMKNIIELNEDDLDCQVQAGVGYIELNDVLKPKGLWFPLDPGPGASIGGMCACRCSGSTAVRYGSMRDNVLNVTAVTSDGTIIKTGSRARKSSAGYDLTRLLIGSEGTLAIITEVTLKVHRIPSHSVALRVSFPTVAAAAAMAREALVEVGTGSIGRIELLDSLMVNVVNRANCNFNSTMTMSPSPWPELPTLMFEVTGSSEGAVTDPLSRLHDMSLRHGGSHVILATNKEECAQLWKVRKECLWSSMSVWPDREAMITDVCVPLSKLPELIAMTREDLDRSYPPLPSPIVAHAGDGNFHVLIMIRPDVPDDITEAKRLANAMAVRAIALGGTCTGEHGIGSGKMDLLRLEMGTGSMSLMELTFSVSIQAVFCSVVTSRKSCIPGIRSNAGQGFITGASKKKIVYLGEKTGPSFPYASRRPRERDTMDLNLSIARWEQTDTLSR
eukprot:gene11618-24322_t